MNSRKMALVAALSLPFLWTGQAWAHGATADPPSINFACKFLDNPENPKNPGCAAAIRATGTGLAYQWNEVSDLNAGQGPFAGIVQDGKICSFARANLAGLDLPRTDFITTDVRSGQVYPIRYKATAPHLEKASIWEIFLTKKGYSPTQPLRVADLEMINRIIGPPLIGDQYQLDSMIPAGRTGEDDQMLVIRWARVAGSDENFISCSPVNVR